MLEILQFIFSSFWVWAGTVVLLGVATEGALRLMATAIALVSRK